MVKMTSPLKYPGAKWSYADWICSYIPEHMIYLEPFFGSGAVFFRKSPTPLETINDIDSLVVNYFRVCRDKPEELARALYFTPFSREEYMSVQEANAGTEINLTGDSVEDARRFAVRCSQGFGSKLADRVGWKNTKHSSGPNNPAIWNKLPETAMCVAERLKNARIEHTDAIDLIRAYNASDCFIYADPPYLGSTRRSRIYRHEMMDTESHIKLLDALKEHIGPVILSGYENELYNIHLSGWHKAHRKGRANSSEMRMETLWMNFDTQTTLLEELKFL